VNLNRQAAEQLLFGGQSAVRFTQDTPIRPDVWLQFAQDPNFRQRLLITPCQGHKQGGGSPGTLAKRLEARLHKDREQRGRQQEEPPYIVYNQTTVHARLSFEEVVRVLLPMSEWWGQRGGDTLLNPPPSDAKIDLEAILVTALKRADQHVREDTRVRVDSTRKQRARAAFSPLNAPSAPTSASESEYERRFAALRGSAANREASSQPDVSTIPTDAAWVVRVAGTLAALRSMDADEIEKHWPKQLWSPRGSKATDSPDLAPADLDQYYVDVVRHFLDLLTGVETPQAETARLIAEFRRPLAGEILRQQVFSVTTCRLAEMAVTQSRATVKADAAVQLFNINCADITWGIVDSGIDATHPAFLSRKTLQSRVTATYDFTWFLDLLHSVSGSAPVKTGGTPPREAGETAVPTGSVLNTARPEHPALAEFQKKLKSPRFAKDLRVALCSGRELDWEMLKPFIEVPHTPEGYRPPIQEHGTHVAGIIGADAPAQDPEAVRGLCPEIQLYDLRVLNESGYGDEFNVMAALQFVRYLNRHKDTPVIHGVNVSLSLPVEVANYACGRTPVCDECDRLVGAGIVVVAAAGNDGYLEYLTGKGSCDNYRSISITDPGNADGVITVGATHRTQPHNYGVSYFSSRGPTGDGRAKPDLVAPGEKIESSVPGGGYKTMDGTSMAAPHVSGAAALLLARHRELLGQPLRIKQILCRTATDLGRERYFQGAGLVDVLRALQSL
jgi:subtilisin family serine protease